MPATPTPKYRCQRRPSGDLAFVELNGVRHYLGAYDSPKSRQDYHRLLAEWVAGSRQIPVALEEITIIELAARFLLYAEGYYRRPDGTLTPELANFKPVLQLLKDCYGTQKVSSFGPLALKALREQMLKKDWSRTYLNKQVARIKLIFKWGVAEELVTPTVYQALLAVPGLKRGRCTARESEPIKSVAETHVEAVRPYVSRQVWTIIQLQMLTGARSGELVVMRARDLKTQQPVWTYLPTSHKTAHHGHIRTIFIGPKAQEILKPYLESKAPSDYLFAPIDAERVRLERRHAQRKTALSCGNVPQENANLDRNRAPGLHYSQASYCRAIARACRKAGIEPWHPHQLRHNAGTVFRREYGIEAAQLLLGHKRADVTQIYAEADIEKAIIVAGRIG